MHHRDVYRQMIRNSFPQVPKSLPFMEKRIRRDIRNTRIPVAVRLIENARPAHTHLAL